MTKKKGKPINFDLLVKFFIRHYDIPTKSDIEKLVARMDRLENLIISTAEGGLGKKASGKNTGKGKATRGKSAMTAADTVLEIIRSFREGVGFVDIQARTGFEEKKLRNIIFRLNKTGKIERKERGIYIAV